MPDRLFPEIPPERLALRPRRRFRARPTPLTGSTPALRRGRPSRSRREPAGGESTAAERAALAERPARGSFLREVPVLFVVALVLAFLLRTFVVQVFWIPSSSMEPTLRIDDRMVVEKLSYRVREPRRGEIVVFEGEGGLDAGTDGLAGRIGRGVGQFLGLVPANARDYVKRVIGLPGDIVELRGGVVTVNGAALDEPYVFYTDTSDFGPVAVPEGTLFFLGDNRPNSADSRSALGFVARAQVVGRALVVLWPPGHTGGLTDVDHDARVEGP